MPDLPISDLIALATSRQWTVLLAVVVGTATRYTKPDVIFPSLSPRWRPLFAAAIAIVGAGSSSVFAGVPLDVAGNAALEAFVLATMGHVFGIQVVRNGAEIPMPGLRKPPSDPPRPGTVTRISERSPGAGLGGAAILMLVALQGCSGLQVPPAVASLADPLLRAVGFCQQHAPERVPAITAAIRDGDRMGALLQVAGIVEDLRVAGVEIPPAVDSDLVRTLAAIEGMQRGLRALDGRDAEGKPVEVTKPPAPQPPIEKPAGET